MPKHTGIRQQKTGHRAWLATAALALLTSMGSTASFGQGRIRPLLDCIDAEVRTVEVNATSEQHIFLTAHLGYLSEVSRTFEQPIGSRNLFLPTPLDRGQPTEFEPGIHERVFSVEFDQTETPTLTWFLEGPEFNPPGTDAEITFNPDDLCAPGFERLDPSEGGRGTTVTAGVEGSNFAPRLSARLVAPGIELPLLVHRESLAQATLEIQIPDLLPLTRYDLVLINPNGGSVTAPAAFEVIEFDRPPVEALVRTGGGILYAGTFGAGVFRSSDDGQTWEAINNGLTDLHILSLVGDPNDDDTLYAGTLDGVFRTRDGGASWESIGGGLP